MHGRGGTPSIGIIFFARKLCMQYQISRERLRAGAGGLRTVLFYLSFGLAPFWIAIAVVFIQAPGGDGASIYWAAAPWLIVVSIPASVATLVISVVTHLIFVGTQSFTGKKSVATTVAFVSYIVLTGAVVTALWWRKEYNKKLDARAESLALEFVRSNKEVARAAGGNERVALASKSISDERAVRYEFSVSGTSTVYAIVNSSGPRSSPILTLTCTTKIAMSKRDPFKGPCAAHQVTITKTPD